MSASPYDEFHMLGDNAAEAGLVWSGQPAVRREAVEVAPGRVVSALVWGDGPAEMVFLHGGAQNAHTWDSVALALDRPIVAIDLPGHGHSDWREDQDYRVESLAADVAVTVGQLAPVAQVMAGMSLGGMTALALAALGPQRVPRLALIDITPGTSPAQAEPILAFIAGPERFARFQDLLDRTVAYNPTRSVSSLRRGVIHNAREFPDGTWGWRWDPAIAGRRPQDGGFSSLWTAVDGLRVPLLLVRGSRSTVVSDEDAAELVRRQPTTRLAVVAGAGHSIQGDQPLALAGLLSRFAGD